MVPPEDSVDPRRGFGRRSGRASGAATPSSPAGGGAPVPGRLLTVEDRCWQCRSKVRGIVGVLVDPALTTDRHGFLPFDAVAPHLPAPPRAGPRAARGR